MPKSHILCALLSVCLLTSLAMAVPRGSPYVEMGSINEGNIRAGIYVALSSTAWTAVLPKRATRRNAILQTLSNCTYDICLSSMSTVSITCSSTTIGIHIEPGGTVREYSESILYGRIEVTGSAVKVYGMDYWDSSD